MKNAFWPAMAAVTVMAAISMVHAAPGDNRVFGQVSAVDATAKTITVTSRNFQDPQAAPTTTTIKVNDDTKYVVDAVKTLDSLKVGDNIRVGGRPDDSGNVEARMITIVPAGAPAGGGAGRPGGAGGPGGRGGGRRGTVGVIATLKPALTITTADGKTITVTTTADTRITGPEPGSWSDVKTDSFINADVTGDAGSQVATNVHVTTGMGGFGRGGGQGGAAGGRRGGRRGGAGAGAGAPAPVQ